MKRKVFPISMLVLSLLGVSWLVVRTRPVGAQSANDATTSLRVMDPATSEALDQLAGQLVTEDPLTKRFAELLVSPEGRLALSGYLNELVAAAHQRAREDAVPRFIDEHFTLGDDGRLIVQADSAETVKRWTEQSKRIADRMGKVKQAAEEISDKLNDSTEAAGLLKRLLADPQAPMVILLGEMKGGDVVERYLSEAMNRIMVDQGNGVFKIVESRREEAVKQIDRFERAERIGSRLRRELPTLAGEYATDDEPHQQLVRYLRNPVAAVVVAIQLSEQDAITETQAIDRLHQHFEQVSVDTPTGLKINDPAAREKLREIYDRVDRIEMLLPRVRERLAEISEMLARDDPLTARLATQMKGETMAAVAAADLPYAESDPGEELRTMLREVLTESNGEYSIKADAESKVADRARELLKNCRQVRRYLIDVDGLLEQLADQTLVESMGPVARYVIFDQVRKHAESYRPDSITLLKEELFESSADGNFRIRQERGDVVRRLAEQAKTVRQEAAIDDF